MANYGRKSHPVYIRDDSEERMARIEGLRVRIRAEAARLLRDAPAERWQTTGSGRKAQRALVANPERAAIIQRTNTLYGRAERLARFFAAFADGPIQ